MPVTRTCRRKDCNNSFEKTSDWDKIYCSRSCAAKVNNLGRNRHKGKKSKVVFEDRACANPECAEAFTCQVWKRKLYCSVDCYNSYRKNSKNASTYVRVYNRDKPCSRCGKGITNYATHCRAQPRLTHPTQTCDILST